jgi:hypothetical protein
MAVGCTLHELPVDIEADAPQMHLLLHPVADARRTLVCVSQPAVNRDPLPEPTGVHHDLPHLLGRRIDVS